MKANSLQKFMKLKQQCCGCFEGLSSDSRMEIVNLLSNHEKLSVNEIAGHFKLKQPTITHHLRNLEENGILASKKIGRQVFYFLKPKCKGECHVFNN
jgi:ArsR family transcriptional regulator, arsenate/arsenite/antimonite-responsive transcriptional repressor